MFKQTKIIFISMLFVFTAIVTLAQQQDLNQLQAEAKALLDAKEYASALAKFQIIVTQNPESSAVPESLYYLGKCYYRLKNSSAAVTTLTTLIQQFPTDSWGKNAYRLLGYSYSALSRDSEAIAAFQKFINKNPTSSYCPDAALRSARIISRNTTASTTDKLNAFKSVIDNYSNSPEAKEAQLSYGNMLWRISEEISRRNLVEKLEKKDETIGYFMNLSQQYTGDTETQASAQMQVGALWIEKARLLDKDQEPQKRLEYFTQAKTELETLLNKYPDTKPEIVATVKLMLAEITMFTLEIDSALPQYQNLIAVFSSDSSCRRPVCMALYWTALLVENQGKYAEAIQEYQKVLDNYGAKDNYLWTNVQAISLYGQYRCYSALGNNIVGAEVLLKLIDRYPDTLVGQRAKEEINKITVATAQ